MPTVPTDRWVEHLLERFHHAAAEHPDLGHTALRADNAEWPFHPLGSPDTPGFTVLQVASDLAQDKRRPIPLRPHWLWLQGRLYQGFYLFRQWNWALTHLAEEAVRRLQTLNDEATGLFGHDRARQLPTDLPSGVNEIDVWMSYVYELLSPQPRIAAHLEILQLPGNVFAAVAGAVEQCSAAYVRVPEADTPVPVVTSAVVGPASPTREFCLIPPNIVRWKGETEVQQRLWHLLGVLLDSDAKRLSFDVIENTLRSEKDGNPKRIQNDLSALNRALEAIQWPWTYHTKSGYVTFEG